MNKSILLIALIAATVAWPVRAGEKSPITSPEMGDSSNPKEVEAAGVRGAATAAKDINAGTLRIFYYGKPWSNGKPLVDETTGYRVQIIGGCAVSSSFRAEVGAYNQTMRDWHTKSEKEKAAQKK